VTSPGYQDAVQRLERLADRLRVVGPRLAAQQGEQAQQTLREIRAGLQRLADLGADSAGEPRRVVPTLAGHALGDQALVLGYDVLGYDVLGYDVLGHDVLGHDVLGTDPTAPDQPPDRGAPDPTTRAAAVRIVAEVYALI
jgi:hypothetical protein